MKYRNPAVAFLIGMTLTWGGLIHVAHAQNRTTLLVLTESADEDSLPADNRVTRRVGDALKEQLNAASFDVLDEQAVTYDSADVNAASLSNGQLVDIARSSVKTPGTDNPILVRAVATYQIFVRVEEKGFTNAASIRVTGRLVDVQSGRFLGSYELVDPVGKVRMHPKNCADRECVVEKVGDSARDIGQAIGNELAVMLAKDRGGQVDSNGATTTSAEQTYSLRFENFDDAQMTKFEDYLANKFSGYRSHEPVNSTGMTHVYSYISTIELSRLRRNLERVMDDQRWEGNITQNGTAFTVRRTALRGTGAAAPGKADEKW
jgi:hypothetical protein